MNQKYKQSFKAGAVAEGDRNKLEEAIKKGREKLRLEVIDKCSRLRDLHPHLKLCLAEQMKFTYLSKGEVFKFRNYPNIDMFMEKTHPPTIRGHFQRQLQFRERNKCASSPVSVILYCLLH